MRRKWIVWGGAAAIWISFTGWYTSFGGPLTPGEIDRYLSTMQENGADPASVALLRPFLESDTGDDFVMINLIEMREPPTRVPGVREGETADDVLARYMEYMWPALLARACHPVLFGSAVAPALDVWGIEGAERWTRAAAMRYRSRRDMMDIVTTPAFRGPHAFKLAAMTKTIAFPTDPWFQLGDPRLVLFLVLLPLALLLQGRRGSERS